MSQENGKGAFVPGKGILLTLTLKNVSLAGQEVTAVLNGEL